MRQRGFTLIELLISMAILVAVFSVLHAVFQGSLRSWQKSDNMFLAAATARSALERMSREISALIVKEPWDTFYCLGFDSASPSGWRTNSKGDEFYFIAAIGTDPENSNLCEVGYWCSDNGTAAAVDDALKRHYITEIVASFDFDFETISSASKELAPGVTGLKFRYFDRDGNEVLSTPGSPDNAKYDSRVLQKPPARIEIILTVESGKGSKATNPDYYQGEFRTSVYLPQ